MVTGGFVVLNQWSPAPRNLVTDLLKGDVGEYLTSLGKVKSQAGCVRGGGVGV